MLNKLWTKVERKIFIQRSEKQTQQIAGKQPPLIPITLLGLKEMKISTKIDFRIKTFLIAIYFDIISWLHKLLSLGERPRGLLSIPIRIIDSN